MFTISNGSCATKKLTRETARELKECHHINYSSESGWTLAYGKDKDDNMIIAVHANSQEEFDDMLNPLGLYGIGERINRYQNDGY